MTTKPLTPQEIIDRLATYFECYENYGCIHISHQNPIRIGDVFENIKEKFGEAGEVKKLEESGATATIFALMNRWCRLGYNKSLQEIVELDTNEARELFNFLATIIQ